MNRLREPVVRRERNWYLRGWEYREMPAANGRVRRKLVYTGEYYRVPLPRERLRRLKILAAAIYLALCGVYLAFELTYTVGGFVWYAGAPCLLAIIPIFYLGMGVFNFVAAEAYFTYRRQRAAWQRLRIGARGAALLLGIGAVGQLVFVLRYGSLLQPLWPELLMLFGALLGAAAAAALAVMEKKVRPVEVPAREYPGTVEKVEEREKS